MSEQNFDEKKSVKTKISWGKLGLFITTLALILFIITFGYGYFELSRVNIQLANLFSHLQTQTNSLQNDMSALQQAVQQSIQKSQDLAKQQEEIINEYKEVQKADLKKWQMIEANYLVKLANDQLQFSHNHEAALLLLKQADQILQSMTAPQELTIRQSLTKDIANLQAAPAVDTTSIFLKLSSASQQINQLPFPATPLTADTTPDEKIPETLPWWKKGLKHSWNVLRKVIVIRKNDINSMPVVLPEEKKFLLQNLQAQLTNAMWAVLQRNSKVYQTSLVLAVDWIKQYFDQNARATQATLQNLSELSKMNVESKSVDLTNTLQLFATYKQSEPAKTTS